MKKFLAACLLLALALPGTLWAALMLWGEDYFAYQLKPLERFRPELAAAAPNYDDGRYWAALPGESSAATLVPTGQGVRTTPAPADVFYIHPTSYLTGDSWNAPLFEDSRAWEMIDVMLAAQASAFNGCCDVYAPHYREATLYSFLDREDLGGSSALALAYGDVKAAFQNFLTRTGDRPFIIASHSQGTYHALRLLAEVVDGTPLQARLVSAYLVGYWIPMDTFGRVLKNIGPCESAQDIGCVVHWSTYGDKGERRTGVPHWYPGGTELVGQKPLLCTNPLSWERDGGRVDAEAHPGALYVDTGGSPLNTLFNIPADVELTGLEPVLPGWTWAECRDGLLHVASQTEGVFAESGASADEDYHILDYNLFYQAVRENAAARVADCVDAPRLAMDSREAESGANRSRTESSRGGSAGQ
mgnify:FL=1